MTDFEVYKKCCQAIDLNFSENIMDTLGKFGDDKATGNRSAGSKACYDAAKYLYSKFNEAGLTNVSMDKFQVNGWTYKGANLSYKDDKGLLQNIVLWGYASNTKAVNEEVIIVDGGKGILVALTWNIEHDDILISSDLEAPAYCSTLAISIKDVNALKDLINANPNKEIKAVFNADSLVEPYADSYNIVGEIQGKSSEVIYLIAHYDGYYHSFFDDANGVSLILGISKAITESGYKPMKTIRIIEFTLRMNYMNILENPWNYLCLIASIITM